MAALRKAGVASLINVQTDTMKVKIRGLMKQLAEGERVQDDHFQNDHRQAGNQTV